MDQRLKNAVSQYVAGDRGGAQVIINSEVLRRCDGKRSDYGMHLRALIAEAGATTSAKASAAAQPSSTPKSSTARAEKGKPVESIDPKLAQIVADVHTLVSDRTLATETPNGTSYESTAEVKAAHRRISQLYMTRRDLWNFAAGDRHLSQHGLIGACSRALHGGYGPDQVEDMNIAAIELFRKIGLQSAALALAERTLTSKYPDWPRGDVA